MALVPAICTQCGKQLTIDDGKDANICPACGTAFVTEKAINNYNTTITNANITVESEYQKLLDAAHGFENLAEKSSDTSDKVKNFSEASSIYWRISKEYPQYYDGWFGYAKVRMELEILQETYNRKFIEELLVNPQKLANEQQKTDIENVLKNFDARVSQIKNAGFSACYTKFSSLDALYDYMVNNNVNFISEKKGNMGRHDCSIYPSKDGQVILRENKYDVDDRFYTYTDYIIENMDFEHGGVIKLKPTAIYTWEEYKHGKSKTKTKQKETDITLELLEFKETKIIRENNFSCYDAKEYKNVFIIKHTNSLQSNDSLGILNLKEVQQPPQEKNEGCYIATAVYGSYDCPEVWVLRRYRDDCLRKKWYGRFFIQFYYSLSPSLVKWFGHKKWFNVFWKKHLDQMVSSLKNKEIKDIKYTDKT